MIVQVDPSSAVPVFEQLRVQIERLIASGQLLPGTRRHNLIYLDDLTAVWEPDGLRLAFTLPAGSYATVLLREVMKTAVAEQDEPAAEDDE